MALRIKTLKQTSEIIEPHIHNERQYFDWLGPKLHINKMEDWYQVLEHGE